MTASSDAASDQAFVGQSGATMMARRSPSAGATSKRMNALP